MSVAAKGSIAAMVVVLALSSGYRRAAASPSAEPEDPLLASLIDEALARNPEVVAAQEAVAAARSRPDQARSLPNPMLSVTYTNDGWAPSLGTQDMTTLAFMGSQDLPYPGKRRLRGDVLTREAEQVEQQLERVKLGVAARLKRAYYGLVLSRDLLDLIREQEEIWKQIEGVARARYVVGQGAQQDVLRVQIEVTRVEQLRTEQEAEVEIRVAELNRLLDRPASSALGTQARVSLRPVEETPVEALDRLSGISPELKSASVGVERAALTVELARKEYKPDFSVQAGYMNRGGLDPMWQAGVAISVPLYRKRLSAGLAEAEAQARALERLVEAIRLQLRFRTQQRLAQLSATERIATLYGQGIVPQDRMSVDAAVANYQTGKVPFIAVLEALTTLYNDRATHLALQASHERTRASLEEASLEDTSGMDAAGPSGTAAVGGSSLGLAGMAAGARASGSMGRMGQ
jgi:outer membrane protein TolC